MNKRLLLLLTALVLVLIFVLVYILSSLKPQAPRVIPTALPSLAAGGFGILSIEPSNNSQLTSIQQITITFSAPIDPEGLRALIQPATDVQTIVPSGNKNVLVVTPKTVWATGATAITIFPETQAKDGRTLGKKIIYQFNTVGLPQNDPNAHENYDPHKEIINKWWKTLPYYDSYFAIVYQPSSDRVIVTIDAEHKEQGSIDFDAYLKKNNIQSRTWITNLNIEYK